MGVAGNKKAKGGAKAPSTKPLDLGPKLVKAEKAPKMAKERKPRKAKVKAPKSEKNQPAATPAPAIEPLEPISKTIDDLEKRFEEENAAREAAVLVPNEADEFDGMAAPSVGELSVIEASVRKVVELQAVMAELQDTLDQFSHECNSLLTKTIPDAMAAARTEEFKTTDGMKVSIKDILNGSLPKEPVKRKKAIAFLIDAGGEDLIKRTIVSTFAKGQTDAAAKAIAALKSAGVSYEDKEDVHSQTYCAFIREMMKAGKTVPVDDLGIYTGRIAKITPPKASKTR